MRGIAIAEGDLLGISIRMSSVFPRFLSLMMVTYLPRPRV